MASEVVIKRVKTSDVWQLVKRVEVETEELRNRFFVLTHRSDYQSMISEEDICGQRITGAVALCWTAGIEIGVVALCVTLEPSYQCSNTIATMSPGVTVETVVK